MKSSTPNLPNIKSIKSDKRFDALIKEQINEHQHIISCHHKEMQDLRDSLSISMEKFESLSSKNDQELKDFKTYSSCLIGILQEKIKYSEMMINEQKKTIEDINDQLLSFQVLYESKIESEKIKEELQNKIKDSNNNYLKSFQELQIELKNLFKVLSNDLSIFKNDMEKEIVRMTEESENNFYVSKLDKDGVLKQVRVYENNMFIIEKKIENIYTLIERINKRG